MAIYNNEFTLDSACVGSEMIDWIAICNWKLLSLKKSYVLHHIIFITACARNVLQHECKRWTLTPLANRTFSNRVTQSGSLAVDASFQFIDVRS